MKSSKTCWNAACNHSRKRGSSSTKCPAMPARARNALTTSTTGPSGTTSASAPARTASFRFRKTVSRCARNKRASRRRYLAAEPGALVRKPISPTELPFEFAMNGFRLVRGFSDEFLNPARACRSRFWSGRWHRWWPAVWWNAARNTGARRPKASGFSTTYSWNCCRRRRYRQRPDIPAPWMSVFMHRCPGTGT